MVDQNKNCSIIRRVKIEDDLSSQIIGQWSCDLRRGRETNQFEVLLISIDAFHFSKGEDRWQWLGDKQGNFSVKSLRSLVAHTDSCVVDSSLLGSGGSR